MKYILPLLIGTLAAVGLTAPPTAAHDDEGGSAPSLAAMDAARDHSAGSHLSKEPGGGRSSAGLLEAQVRGLDVSAWQEAHDEPSNESRLDWRGLSDQGARFVYIKATEDDDYANRFYPSQYAGAHAAGLKTGSYHFANAGWSDARSQAEYFVAKSHPWTADGQSLPPMLDLEPTAHGQCHGKAPDELVSWIREFLQIAEVGFGRAPLIYTTASWWSTCTADSAEFSDHPLTIARWRAVDLGPGALPAAWDDWTFWQHWDDDPADYSGPTPLLPGDQNLFNGSEEDLAAFAAGDGGVGVDEPGTGADSAAGEGGAANHTSTAASTSMRELAATGIETGWWGAAAALALIVAGAGVLVRRRVLRPRR